MTGPDIRRRCIAGTGVFLILVMFMSRLACCEELQAATFLPQWVPQAQFAGYYVALSKGFYQNQGVALTILPGGPDSPPADMLSGRETDFTTLFLSTAVQLRAGGIPLVNIAQIGQKSGFMLVARKSSGIFSPQDLNGKRISLWPAFQTQVFAFFKKYRIHATIIPQSYSINLFLEGGVDAACAMWYNEYHTILNSGINADELTTFFFDRYGLNFPEDGIYCLKETLEKRKGICDAFVRASLEGWQYAFDHPEEAVDIVMTYARQAHTGTNRVHQLWMLNRIRDISLAHHGDVPMGALSAHDYQTVAGELKSNGMIDEIPSFNTFYTPCLGISR